MQSILPVFSITMLRLREKEQKDFNNESDVILQGDVK